MTPRRLAAALLCLCLLGATAHCAAADSPIYARLTVPIFFESEIPKDIQSVSEAVSRLTEAKIGASVQLVPILFVFGINDPSDVADLVKMSELELLEKQGVSFDVVTDDLPNVQFIELDRLIDRYGRKMRGLIGQERLDHARKDGKLYSLPSISDYAASAGVAMRKDIVEKYHIDISAIHSLADLDAVFEYVSQREPDLKMICPNQSRRGILSRMEFRDAVVGSVCDLSPEDPAKIVNYYATGEYQSAVELLRKWYLAGYMPDEMALQNIRASQMVEAGELFAYTCAYKPGIEYEESASSGRDMAVAKIMDPIVTRRSFNISQWGISKSCINPGKAMQFLNLLYTDSDLINLLTYGVEGKHYVRLPDGTIDYPEGVDAGTVGYKNTLPWVIPNQLLSFVWHGNDPDVWQETDHFNKTAKVSEAIDFTFDPSSVKAENDALNAIENRYSYGLETGQLDPAVYLPQMLEEMEAAGVDRVIGEAQRQYDLFRERKGERP